MVSEEGLRLIATFRQLKKKLGLLSTWIDEDGREHAAAGFSRRADRRLSTGNAFDCGLGEIKLVPVNNGIKLEVTPNIFICALVMNRPVTELDLIPYGSVAAVVNNMSIMLEHRR